MLAGRVKQKVPGWRQAEHLLPRGWRAVRGHVILSHDHLLLDGAGQSVISVEDYAVAMIDELENATHIRQPFTVGY